MTGQPSSNRWADTLRDDGTVYLSELRERGWNLGLVKRFLGDPEVPTIRRPSGTTKQAGRWLLQRVLEAEASSEWASALAVARKSVAASKRSSAKSAESVIDWARTTPIHLRQLPLKTFAKVAIRHWQDWNESGDIPIEEALPRLMVNYLRHEASAYDSLLDQRASQVGLTEARLIIRRRLYALIAEQYPMLSGETKRQLQERESGSMTS